MMLRCGCTGCEPLEGKGLWPWHRDQTQRGDDRTTGTLKVLPSLSQQINCEPNVLIQTYMICDRVSKGNSYTGTRGSLEQYSWRDMVEAINRHPCIVWIAISSYSQHAAYTNLQGVLLLSYQFEPCPDLRVLPFGWVSVQIGGPHPKKEARCKKLSWHSL
jgi:hypothetical protein